MHAWYAHKRVRMFHGRWHMIDLSMEYRLSITRKDSVNAILGIHREILRPWLVGSPATFAFSPSDEDATATVICDSKNRLRKIRAPQIVFEVQPALYLDVEVFTWRVQ